MGNESPEDRRFKVHLFAEITELVPGSGNSPDREEDFAKEEINYNDVDYVTVVAMEQIWGQMHEELTALGPERIKWWIEHGDEVRSKVDAMKATQAKLHPDQT